MEVAGVGEFAERGETQQHRYFLLSLRTRAHVFMVKKATIMKIGGSVLSLSFIFSYPPEDEEKKNEQKKYQAT